MSLKAIHIVFVTACVLMALFVSGWAFKQYTDGGRTLHLVCGVVSLISAGALVYYGKVFLRKLRHISYL